jgi:hypothetical protein
VATRPGLFHSFLLRVYNPILNSASDNIIIGCRLSQSSSPRDVPQQSESNNADTTCSQPCVYTPLEPGSIRVLKLRAAADREAELHGELVACRMDEAPEFEAVSYVWGPPVFSHKIILPEGVVDITESLASALRQFRRVSDERVLWADALCINQEDVDEKGQQVSIMGDIYKSATRCLAWLGPATGRTAAAVESLNAIASKAAQMGVRPDASEDSTYFNRPTVATALNGSRSKADLDRDTKLVWAVIYDAQLDEIFDRPWFYRLWIIQEAALCSSMEFHCGDYIFEWNSVTLVMAVCMAIMRDHLVHVRAPFNVVRPWYMVSFRNERKLMSMFDKVNSLFAEFGSNFRHGIFFECQDARDRIYALASLRPSNSPILITPDYRKSVVQVYTDFAKQFLSKGDVLALGQSGISFRRQPLHPLVASEDEYLPSWAHEYRPEEGHEVDLPWNHCQYISCGDDLNFPDIKTPPELEVPIWKQRTIEVPIRIIDTTCDEICAYVNGNRPTATHPLRFRTLTSQPRGYATGTDALVGAILDRTRKAVHGSDRYFTGEDVRVAVLRTILADATAEEVKTHLERSLDIENEQALLELWELYEKYCINHHNDELISLLWPTPTSKFDHTKASESALEAFKVHIGIMEVLQRSRFVVTTKGYIGLVPPYTQSEDVLVQIDAMTMPLVVRPVLKGINCKTVYIIIGPCYVHGFMYGKGPKSADSEAAYFF